VIVEGNTHSFIMSISKPLWGDSFPGKYNWNPLNKRVLRCAVSVEAIDCKNSHLLTIAPSFPVVQAMA
jgi:hypothetical protein